MDITELAELIQSMALDYRMGGISEETFKRNLGYMVKSIDALPYDSEVDTLKHIKRVNELLINSSIELLNRAKIHDNSKMGDVEKSYFDEYTPKLKSSTYGSDEYKELLKGLGNGLKHHYKNNTHHPEHYKNGVNGMNLFDVVEMFFDWKAASERHENGSIMKSIDINKDRFQLSEQLCDIFKNTAIFLKYSKDEEK